VPTEPPAITVSLTRCPQNALCTWGCKMSRKWFLYLCAVLAIVLSSAVIPLFEPAVAVAASPDTPSNVLPADGATAVSLTPFLQSSAFSDSDVWDNHAASRWQVRTSSGDYSSPVFDSGNDKSNLTAIAIPSSTLDYSTTYYWHVRHQDSHKHWSAYSNETSFTTVGAPTVPPAVVTRDATGLGTTTATLNGNLSSLGTGTSVNVSFQYGTVPGSYTNEAVAQARMATGTFSADLSGLNPGTTYYFRAKAVGDGTSYGSQITFSTSTSSNRSPSRPSNAFPANAATGMTLTPTLMKSSGFSDPDAGDTHAASQWQLRTASGSYSSPVYDSSTDASHLTSVRAPALNYSTTYYWHVRHQDNHGAWSSWSAETSFATANEVTAPVISGVTATNIATTSATITWTTDEVATSQLHYGLTTEYGSVTTLESKLVTGHSVNLTGLSSFKTYHYRVKSSDVAGNPVSSADYTFTTADVTVPTNPVVSDDGESTTDLTQLHASWTSSGVDSGFANNQYAIGTTSGATDVVNWTSVGTDTAVTKTGLNLSAGTTYYFAVKAKNGQGLWSNVGVSDGIVAQATASDGNGELPNWAWAPFMGIGAVALVLVLVYLAWFKKPAEQQ